MILIEMLECKPSDSKYIGNDLNLGGFASLLMTTKQNIFGTCKYRTNQF